MWKIPLFPIHQPGEFFFLISPVQEANFGEKSFSQIYKIHYGFFFEKMSNVQQNNLNLEQTFFLRETFM